MKAENLIPETNSNAVRLKANYSLLDSKASEISESSRSSWYTPQIGKTNPVPIQIYENSIVLDFPRIEDQFLKPPDRTGTKVNKFSKKSRIRIMKKFNRIRTAELSEGIFITLTCRHWSISAEEFQYGFRKKFLPGLKKLIPNLAYAYRLEFHKSNYPHFHMFAWSTIKSENLRDHNLKLAIRELWWSIIQDDSTAARKHSCDIVRINNRRKAFAYISKYLAKTDNEESDERIGRRWSLSTNLNLNPISDRQINQDDALMLLDIVKNILRERMKKDIDLDSFLAPQGKTEIWLSLEEIQELMSQLDLYRISFDIDGYIKETNLNSG